MSVIVPFHDEIRYLFDCLGSLEEQTFRDFEIICVCDHCETDVEEEISKVALTVPIKVISLERSNGVAAARNLGIEEASGEYIYFLDCDDYIEKDTLEQMVQYDEDVIYSNIYHTWYKPHVLYQNEEMLAKMEQEKTGGSSPERQDPLVYVLNENGNMYGVTVLSMLIRKSLLDMGRLCFKEGLYYFSDYPFTVRLFTKAESTRYCEKALYIKRKHNDPINLPALSQTKNRFRFIQEGIFAYEMSIIDVGKNSSVGIVIQKQFLRFFTRDVAPFLREAGKKEQKEIFEQCLSHIKKITPQYLEELTRYQRRLICKATNEGIHSVLKMLKYHAAKQTFYRVLKSRAQLKKYLYRKIFSKLPMLENTIMLESFFGKSYSDSPKYIFEYLNRNYPGKYKYVWVLNKGKKLPFSAKKVKRSGFRFHYYMARCKYMVFNSRQPEYFIKREGNVFLETWHGTPLKKLVFDMEEVTAATPLYKQQFYTQTRSWDYLVAPNEFSAKIFQRAFMYDNTLLRYGYPRNDILYLSNKEEIVKKIKERIRIPECKKVILYAPTWRDDEFYGPGRYKFTLKLDLGQMREKLGDEYVIILRTHYFISDILDLSKYKDFAYNVSKYDDIAELYLISDMLITDYSSVFFDYANLKRPMLFYTYDYEKYRDLLRGFYINMEEEIPGSLLKTTDEVIEVIKNISEYEKEYHEKYELFYNKYCDFENGKAAENIVKAVFSPEESKGLCQK